jgi:hypothetical protein
LKTSKNNIDRNKKGKLIFTNKSKIMKTKNLIIATLLVVFQLSIFTSCEKQEEAVSNIKGIIPTQFSVDIPSSLSNNGASTKSAQSGDTINGNAIYANLNTFIYIGQGAAKLVEQIMVAIAVYNINQPMILTYQSDEDSRMKNLVVEANATFEGATWQYKLTIYDAEAVTEADSGKALQVFWNIDPVEGIAIIKPYNCNRITDADAPDAIFRIDYSERADASYDKRMTVQISSLPAANTEENRFAINNLKMFVGKKGDVVDVFGNSNHPNARLFAVDSVGFNWAFVASALDSKNIGVAEVGLPPCSLNETSREVLLGYYSIKNVFTREIQRVYPSLTEEMIAPYLANTEAPGYFGNRRFIQAGTAPSTEYNEIDSRILDMIPFNPSEINALSLSFQ